MSLLKRDNRGQRDELNRVWRDGETFMTNETESGTAVTNPCVVAAEAILTRLEKRELEGLGTERAGSISHFTQDIPGTNQRAALRVWTSFAGRRRERQKFYHARLNSGLTSIDYSTTDTDSPVVRLVERFDELSQAIGEYNAASAIRAFRGEGVS